LPSFYPKHSSSLFIFFTPSSIYTYYYSVIGSFDGSCPWISLHNFFVNHTKMVEDLLELESLDLELINLLMESELMKRNCVGTDLELTPSCLHKTPWIKRIQFGHDFSFRNSSNYISCFLFSYLLVTVYFPVSYDISIMATTECNHFFLSLQVSRFKDIMLT